MCQVKDKAMGNSGGHTRRSQGNNYNFNGDAFVCLGPRLSISVCGRREGWESNSNSRVMYLSSPHGHTFINPVR